ncbi:Glutathione S-transferase-like protein ustS [Hypsizygus marmoreus]|uniref:Glutathione S-transferase-like protein ustS n=1 Tax=Hypsizygus marmoreus TaxID=39966 RepID=A0A369K6D1_HYPMA|nr:Glutathione S-transferase-like protein ustS [Hypsizygus marmoreus]
MSNLITFYDIPTTKAGQPFSPNTWKTRYSLNFKGIPYHTVWVEYPDIEELCKKIGAPPTSVKPDGSPFYTLPVIYDPTTNTAISESILIAEYLDAKYPDNPKLLPPGTRPLQHAFSNAYLPTGAPVLQFAMPATHRILNPSSEVYFRFHREKLFGKTMETLTPVGKAREDEWAKVKAGFNTVDGWLQKGKEDGPYFLGKENSFVDFVVGARLMWLRRIFGEDSPEWNDIKTWNEGRWAAFVDGIRKYEAIH